MSVAMWNCHLWPLHVSSNVKLLVLWTQCQHWGGYIWQPIWVLHLKIFTDVWSWSLHLISYGGYIWQLIWVPYLKIWTHIWSWSLHLTSYGGYIWPSWALRLKTWPAKMSFNNNITCYTWQICALIDEISVAMSVAMWNCHYWLLDISSNVQLPFLTTRCQ